MTAACAIRRAAASDAAEVAACVAAAFAPYVERIGKPPAPMLQDYAAVIAERQVWVASDGQQIIGALVLDTTGEGFLLDTVAVLPSRRGTGIGRKLLEFAQCEAQRQGHTSIYLYCNEKMTENQALYSRIGYTEYGRRTEDGYARVYFGKLL